MSSFPNFSDGDVKVIISTSRIYTLHSHVLARCSTFFRDTFDTTTAPRLTAAARRDGAKPWRFQLVSGRNHDLNDMYGIFVPVQVSENGRISSQIQPRAAAGGGYGDSDGDDKHWDWLFGCFYGIVPGFDNSTFAATVRDCFVLINAADTIKAIDAVRGAVDLALFQQDTVLWESIAKNPVVWAELGRRIKSAVIFKEAVIHLVGKWKMLSADDLGGLPKDIAELCGTKWEELELAKRAIEIRIAGHYPEFLSRNHADKPSRTSYAQNIYTWMCLCFFRQYMTQTAADERNRQARDGGYSYYKAFFEGGEAYLNHGDMQMFLSLFPMSARGNGVIEAHMNVLKEDLKDFVKDLVEVRTHVDPAKLEGIKEPWLTCAVVNASDFPWLTDAEKEEERQKTLADNDAGSIGSDEMDADDEG